MSQPPKKRVSKISASSIRNKKHERIEPLREELRPYIEETSVGNFIRHPFCNSPVFDIDRCALIHEQIDRRTAQADACFEAGDYVGFLNCVDITFQPEFVQKDAWLFEDAQYWSLVRTAYDNQKCTVHYRALFEGLLAADRPAREHLMNAEEREALAKLPNVLTIYRGFGDDEFADGVSWTLHKPAAIWHAHWYAPERSDPTVQVGRILKRDAYAYCGDGDILLPPEDVRGTWHEDVSHITEARAPWRDYVPVFDLDAYLRTVG